MYSLSVSVERICKGRPL